MMETAFRARDHKSGIDSMASADVQRPPVYNAEDYTGYLRKYCKLTGVQLYVNTGSESSVKTNKTKLRPGKRSDKPETRGLSDKHQMEMGLKQFTSISELLNKLKIDLHLSYHSFLKEFISEPNDGVTLLLDLLKVIQLSQTNISGVTNNTNNMNNGEFARLHQSVFKKALADEHECLLCLKLCVEAEDGGLRLVEHPSGLFTVSVCVMSNFSKSRVLALQLLTKMCTINQGHKQVSDAVSMLRLRFGEPVRFKFLIGMLNSFNSGAFQISCLRFLNTFVETADNYRERVHIQAELEDAGLDISQLKKLLSKFGNQSDLLKEELNIWNKNYLDVNSLVTDKFIMQKSLDKAKTDLESLRQKYQELELKHRKMLTEFSASQAKCDCYESRWVEGASSETSDQDSGKHSDTSLVNSSEECWAEIDKINKSFHKRGGKTGEPPQPSETPQPNNQRNVPNAGEQRPGVTPGVPLTPTVAAETDSDKSSYSEKQGKEQLDEDGAKKGVNIVIIESQSSKEDNDNDTYVERDTLQEEAVMVESQTISINQKMSNHVRPERSSGRPSLTSYDEVPLPASPRPLSKYRARDKMTRRGELSDVRISPGSHLTDEENPGAGETKRQPRPPIRRRPRSKMIAERPKSAPPEKYESPQIMFHHERNRSNNFSLSRDFSDEEASESYLRPGCYDPGESNQGTLESVSAKSFGFIRPSQRLLEREHNKRLKRHKSFFNADSLFGKKNSLIRRAESFHHGAGHHGSHNDYYFMNSKYSSKDARERAKSVDRLLSAGDDDKGDHFDKPIMKSKSMEFLKSKILRKPSKLQKKSPPPEISKTFLGQSMFELHKTPNYSPAAHSNSRLYPDWPFANSSVYPSREFSKQDVRHSQSSSKLCEATQHLPPHGNHSVGSQNYDWRQDTPFWNYSRQKRNDNVMNWGLADDGPPKWVPPPPQPHSNKPDKVQSKPPRRVPRESLSPAPLLPLPVSPPAPAPPHHQMGFSRLYPGHGLPVNQAVNSIYLPPTSYYVPSASNTISTSNMEDSMLEITELEDEPLGLSVSLSGQETGRILELPSGLY